MSEGKVEWSEEADQQCQLCVDLDQRVLIFEFSRPVDVFAFDVETAEELRDALTKGIQTLRHLDS